MRILRLSIFCTLALWLAPINSMAASGSIPQHPQWVEFYVDSQQINYIDVESIHRTYGKNAAGAHDVLKATAWFLMDFPMHKPDGSVIGNSGQLLIRPHSQWASKFSSTMDEVEFDCQASRSFGLHDLSFRGRMGTGKVVESFDGSPGWNSDTGNSNEQWEDLACLGFPYGYLKKQDR